MDIKQWVGPGMGQHAQVYRVNGQDWVVKRKYRQTAGRLQAMKDHNEQVCNGQGDKQALMATLPMADAMTLKTQGVNVFNPNDDDMAYILKWMATHRPWLIGDKFKAKRRALELPSRLIKEGVNGG